MKLLRRLLAQAFEPLLPLEQVAKILEKYQPVLAEHYLELMRAKLGLEDTHPDDIHLVKSLLDLMEINNVDYTNFFRRFSKGEELSHKFDDTESYEPWFRLYKERATLPNRELMLKSNPKYILRNYLAEQAIRKAEDERDYSEIDKLLKILRIPTEEQEEFDGYSNDPPEWARHIEVSCSS